MQPKPITVMEQDERTQTLDTGRQRRGYRQGLGYRRVVRQASVQRPAGSRAGRGSATGKQGDGRRTKAEGRELLREQGKRADLSLTLVGPILTEVRCSKRRTGAG